MQRKLAKKTEAYVRQKMSGEVTGHDWFHVDRVRRTALLLAKTEQDPDLLIIELAALLHDIGDWKINTSGKSEEVVLRETCDVLGYPPELTEKILDIILHMSYSKNISRKQNLSLEGKIVQDADRLDALGAIGIARAFAYGGWKEREIYNPDIEPRIITSLTDYKSSKSTTINHFYEKILQLRSQMNTKTAKRLARSREKFINTFLKEFYAEWDGRK